MLWNFHIPDFTIGCQENRRWLQPVDKVIYSPLDNASVLNSRSGTHCLTVQVMPEYFSYITYNFIEMDITSRQTERQTDTWLHTLWRWKSKELFTWKRFSIEIHKTSFLFQEQVLNFSFFINDNSMNYKIYVLSCFLILVSKMKYLFSSYLSKKSARFYQKCFISFPSK